MEPKFQTSFIPKKTNSPAGITVGNVAMQKPKVHGGSLFMAIAVVLFIISIAVLAGAYFWKSYLKTKNAEYKNELALEEKKFNSELIQRLKKINFQIDTAKSLVQNHLATSLAFDVLQRITVSDIRLISMDFKNSSESSGVSLSIKGLGKNLSAVAFQSDILSKLDQYGLPKSVMNPSVYDPGFQTSGAVTFNLSTSIDRASLSYKKAVSGEGDENK